MNRWIACALLFGFVVWAAPVEAAKKQDEKMFVADTKDAFVEQVESVRKQMEPGGRFEFVRPEERSTVEARFTQMLAIFELGNVDSLPKAKIADLYVAQEDINAILTKRDGKRVLCERVKMVGSHMKTLQCVTYAERERARLATQEYLRNTARPTRAGELSGDGR